MPIQDVASLRAFRTDQHCCFPRRADALFEFVDVLLTAETATSLPHLSLKVVYRRGCGSLYAALPTSTSRRSVHC
jgi:hypothetical protein